MRLITKKQLLVSLPSEFKRRYFHANGNVWALLPNAFPRTVSSRAVYQELRNCEEISEDHARDLLGKTLDSFILLTCDSCGMSFDRVVSLDVGMEIPVYLCGNCIDELSYISKGNFKLNGAIGEKDE